MRNKSRLTITLPQNIVNQVDGLVDGRVIRNRSHAIETLLSQSLSPRVKSAVILAGGDSAQVLSPLLKKITGRNVLSITLEHLKKFGITHVIIAAGEHQSALEKQYGAGDEYGIRLEYIAETKPLGTGGVVKKAQSLLGDQTFLVLNGDCLTNLDLLDFIEFHQREKTVATIAVKPRMGEKKYGQAFMQGNKIMKFLNIGTNQGISIVNTGMYIFEPEIFKLIPHEKTVSIEKEIFPQLAENKELSAFIFQGLWFDISDDEALSQAEVQWIASS